MDEIVPNTPGSNHYAKNLGIAIPAMYGVLATSLVELGSKAPLMVVIAGPNGAGKTTLYDAVLSATGMPFVNADLLAKARFETATVENAYAAMEIANEERQRLLGIRASFITETVFSHPSKIDLIETARRLRYLVVLIFVCADSIDLLQLRIGQRVEAGGHDVPSEKLRARYPRALEQLQTAISRCDVTALLDNGGREPNRTVAVFKQGHLAHLAPPIPRWASPFIPRRAEGNYGVAGAKLWR